MSEKLKKRSLVDDEAEEEEEKPTKIRKVDDDDEEDDGSEEEAEQEEVDDQDDDDDHFEADGFVVGDDENHSDDDEEEEDGEDKLDENDSEEDEEVVTTRKKKFSRLIKQRKGGQAEEDDLILIQDQKAQEKPTTKSSEVDNTIKSDDEQNDDNSVEENKVTKDDAVEPEEYGSDDDGLNDFIADRKKSAQGVKKRTIKRDKDGPTVDQMEDARAIFGDGYDDEFDDENEELDGEKVGGQRDQDGKAGGKGVTKSQFEYIQLVQTFCLDEDEEIRSTDIPERFQLMTKEYLQYAGNLVTKPEPSTVQEDMEVEDAEDGTVVVKKPKSVFIRSFTDLERSLEAIWIATQLMLDYQREEQSKHPPKVRVFEQPKISVVTSYDALPPLPPRVQFQNPDEETALVDGVRQVLIYLQVDFLEVPYIHLYKQDYLLPYFTRNTIWKIYFYHEQYCQLQLNKMKTEANIKDLSVVKDIYEKASERPGGDSLPIPEQFQHFQFPAIFLTPSFREYDHDSTTLETTIQLKHGLQDWWKNFPIDIYSRVLEDATDEMLVHDMLSYFRVIGLGQPMKQEEEHLAAAADTTTVLNDSSQPEEPTPKDNFLDDDDEDEFYRSMNMPSEAKKEELLKGSKGNNNSSAPTAAAGGGVLSIQRRHTKFNKYTKYKNNAYLRTFMNLVVHPSYAIASAIETDQDLTPPISMDNMCDPAAIGKQFAELCHFKSVAELFYHASLLIATEISLEPTIRKMARDIFRNRGTLSTRPTKRGLQMITPFNEYFGIHYLEQKPLREIYGSTEGLLLFMQIIDAEQQGLITVTIFPPQKLENNLYTNDSAPFLFTPLKLMSKFVPPIPGENDVTGGVIKGWTESWRILRLNTLQSTIEKHIFPMTVSDIRKELIRLGKDEIMHAMTRTFEQRLTIGPYRVPRTIEQQVAHGPYQPPQEDKRQRIADILLASPLRTVYENVVGIFLSSEDSIYGHLVQIVADGTVGHTLVIAKQGKGQIRDKVKTFLYDTQPGLIVINSSSGYQGKELVNMLEKFIVKEINETLELDYNVQRAKREQHRTLLQGHRRKRETDGSEEDSDEEDKADESDDDEPFRPFQPQVIIAEDDVANIVKASPAAKVLYPDFTADSIAAASLARATQEPLTEFALLFRSVDSTFLFGYETLYLQLHPLQKMMKSHKRKIVKWLETRLVNAVSDIGVNLNQAMKFHHYYLLLPFIPGFGPRKADLFKHQIQTLESSSIPNRKYLYTSRLLTGSIYTNTIGFLKIFPPGVTEHLIRHVDGIPINEPVNLEVLFDNDKLFPLDITRIHPEFYNIYDYAPKICADALEVECNPSHITDIVKRLMKTVRNDLAKRIKRYPGWMDLWDYGAPIPHGVIDADDTAEDLTLRPSDKRFSIELNDSLSQLVLQEYAKDLHAQGQGKRRLTMELIKNELRYPFVDLRTPLASIFHTPRYFDLINGVNDSTLFVGLQIGCTVLEVKDDSYVPPGSNGEVIRRQKAFVRTDNNLRGVISMYEVIDDRVDTDAHFRLQDYLVVNAHYIAVIIGVNKSRNQLELSVKPSRMRHDEGWWLTNRTRESCVMKWYEEIHGITNPSELFDHFFREEDALEAYAKAHSIVSSLPGLSINNGGHGNGYSNGNGGLTQQQYGAGGTGSTTAHTGLKRGIITRVIYHPLFGNYDFKEAEERLKILGRAGAVLIRPSSKGANYLTITWAFQPNWYKHISILEKGKRPGELGLGKELYIQESDLEHRAYADLDEINAMYIEPMNELVAIMVKHRYFRSESSEVVEEEMKRECKENPHRIPYFLRFEAQKPGMFVLTWLNPHTYSIKTMRIEVRPEGYKLGSETFSSPSKLIEWFKKMNERAVQAATASSTSAASGHGTTGAGTSRGGNTIMHPSGSHTPYRQQQQQQAPSSYDHRVPPHATPSRSSAPPSSGNYYGPSY